MSTFDILTIEESKRQFLGDEPVMKPKVTRPDLDNLDMLKDTPGHTYSESERAAQEDWKTITRMLWKYEDLMADYQDEANEGGDSAQACGVLAEECGNVHAALKTVQYHLRKRGIC